MRTFKKSEHIDCIADWKNLCLPCFEVASSIPIGGERLQHKVLTKAASAEVGLVRRVPTTG